MLFHFHGSSFSQPWSLIQESSRVVAQVKSQSGIISLAARQCASFAMALGLVFGFLPFALAQSVPQAIQVEVSRIGDALHLEFLGAREWKYDMKRDGNVVTLRLPALGKETLARIRSVKDPLVKGVEVNEAGVDGSTELVFSVNPDTDFFDYLTDQPSRLVVDFFPMEPDAAKAAAAAAKEPAKQGTKPKSEAGKPADQARISSTKSDEGVREPANAEFMVVAKNELPPLSPAELATLRKDFSHGIFDGGDPGFRRFTMKDFEIKDEAIVASRMNYYLPFPMLELGTPQLKTLLTAPPTYEIVPKENRENKEARVLMGLHGEKKFALFLKAADEFLTTYPQTAYDEIIRYMVADTHFELWRTQGSMDDFEIALGMYQKLSEKYPDSPITPRTLLLVAYSFLDRGDSFAALKAFQKFKRTNPNSRHLDRVDVSIAEAFLKLNRFDDAYKAFDEIEKSAKTKKGRQEAAFRKGDVFFRKKDFEQAIKEYDGAASRHPDAATQFANSLYNKAEAEFRIARYKDSLENYRRFLQYFPDHEHGGYAMTRMGELLGILGGGPARAQGAFMESHFRYRATPGAGVARVRLLTSRMPEMKSKELVTALAEIEAITSRYVYKPLETEEKQPEQEEAEELAKLHDPTKRRPELPGIDEFSTLLIADGYTARNEFDTAIKQLISYYQKFPQSPNKDRFLSRISANMAEGIRAAVDRGQFLEALRRYSRESGSWLKNVNRPDLRFNVGRAYELAGVHKEAREVYNQTLKSLEQQKTAAPLIFDRSPSVEAVQLRLAAVAAKEKSYSAAETELKKIKDLSRLAPKEQIEHAEVAADVAENRGQAETARKYLVNLIETWKGDPKLTSPLHLRIARLYSSKRSFKEADSHLATIVSLRNQGTEEMPGVPDDVHAQALEMRGDLFVTRGMRGEAVATYGTLLEEYEEKRPLASIRYRMGQILYEDGDLKGAERVWADLTTQDNMWARLAIEQMQGAKWQNEYKKYLNRIPAAAELRDASSAKTR
jgi:tetratricopeptide (TPR) repeat protein